MAQKFDRFFAGEVAETPRLPRADVGALSNTGQGFEAAALQEVGGALGDVSAVLFKWREREGNSEYDTARGLGFSMIGEHSRTNYADSTALEAGKKKLEADLAKIPSTNGLKNKSGHRKFKAWLELNKESRDKISGEKEIRMIKANSQIALFKGLTNVAQITDEATARQEIDTLIAGGIDDNILTANQALTLKDRFTDDWETADLSRRSQAVVITEGESKGEVDWAASVDWLAQVENTEGVDSKVLKGLRSNANEQKRLQLGREEDALKERQEKQLGDIYEKIRNNDSEAISAIDGSDLSETEKEGLRDKLGKKIDFNWPEYDKVVTIIDGVAKGTHTVEQGRKAISAGVTEGFYGAGRAIALRTKLSTNSKDGSPTRTPAHTRGITAIEEIMDLQIKAKELKLEDVAEGSRLLQQKNQLKNEFDSWAAEKPRTDEETEKKVKSLTRIPVKNVTLSWWEGWLRRDAELVSEKMDELSKQDVFDTLSDAEKESARKRFERGESVDDIVRLLE